VSTTFYEAVLPPAGPYCAVGIQGSKVITTFHPTLDELQQRGDALAAQQIDAYFALATFADPADGRKGDNATFLRSFFLDIDAGDNKPYSDQPAAAQALRQFVTDATLPPPTIVNSGRGLHAYWPISEPVAVAQWRGLARAFKRACATHGLKFDPVVPADAARILRMPGTQNFKADPPLPVQVVALGHATPLAVFERLFAGSAPPDLTEAKAFGMDAMTSAVAQGDFPPASFARIARKSLSGAGCAQIAHALTDAATLEEPLWRAALAVAWRCTDAETAIHKLSSAHPEYDADRTVEKAQGTKGPTTCQWYRDNYSARCAGCTHRVTSPIQLGEVVPTAPAVGDTYVISHQLAPDNTPGAAATVVQVTIPAYPFPYFRGVNGGVYQRVKDAKGNPDEVEIYKYDLYVTHRQYDSEAQGDGEGELVSVHLHTPHDGIRRFTAPVSHLLVKEKMRDLLLRHGVVALAEQMGHIMGYLASSIRNLQKRYAADITRNQMGWTPDLSGFVLGELEYGASAIRLAPAASATRHVAPLLTARGSLAEWRRVADFYARPGLEVHALALFFGFGAPLLRLYGGIEVRGALVNLMSNKSGTGKTTVQTVINSIFGHPSGLLLKKDDTINARMQWMGLLNHLPVTMDEITNLTDEAASALIYDIPQGRGRHRMEAQHNKLRTNTTSWQTFAISSSNSSLYDKLMRLKSAADGEVRRVIELPISRPMTISKTESDAVFRLLQDNYGVAGPVFLQYVMSNRETVDAVFARFRTRLDADLRLDQSDRFYAMAFAVAFTAGQIARMVGLHDINVQKVYDVAVQLLRGIRIEVVSTVTHTSSTAAEALAEYLNENLSNTLVINGRRAGSLPNAPIHTPRGPLRVRFEPDSGEVWIPVSGLREYFATRQVDYRAAVAAFTERGFLKNSGEAISKRIGAGALAGFESANVRCLCFDAAVIGLDTAVFVDATAAPTNP
jgi:hypothetical protein